MQCSFEFIVVNRGMWKLCELRLFFLVHNMSLGDSDFGVWVVLGRV